MLKNMLKGLLISLGIGLGCNLSIAAPNPPQITEDGQSLLQKMYEAINNTNYSFYYTKAVGSQIESMCWNHGIADNKNIGQSLYLDNDITGFFKIENNVIYFNNNQILNAVKNGRMPSVFDRLGQIKASKIIESYEPIVLGVNRIANRQSITLKLLPRWNDRYSYLLNIDYEHYLPLNFQVVNPSVGIIESYNGTYLDIYQNPNDEIKNIANLKYENFYISKNDEAVNSVDFDWTLSYIPTGFELVFKSRYSLGENGNKVEHLLYTDGLVDFSVYKLKSLDSIDYPIVHQGSTNLLRYNIPNNELVIVGELPLDIEQKIVQSYKDNKENLNVNNK